MERGYASRAAGTAGTKEREEPGGSKDEAEGARDGADQERRARMRCWSRVDRAPWARARQGAFQNSMQGDDVGGLMLSRTTLPNSSGIGTKEEGGRPVGHLLQISRQEVLVVGSRVVASAGSKKVTNSRLMVK